MARIDTHPDPQIGSALRWLRNRAGLQQREVSERMSVSGSGISTVWLSQVENGRQRPSRHLVRELLDVYGQVDVSALDELLLQRPWETEGLIVTSGSEWDDVSERVQALAGVAPSSSNIELARSLAELNELFLRLSDDARSKLLRHARSLVSGT